MCSSQFSTRSLVLLCLLAAGTAEAVPVMELMNGGPSTAWSGSRTLSGDSTAAYFNPALLVDTRAHSNFGLTSMWPNLTIELQPRPPGFDVSEAIFRARVDGRDGLTRLDRRPLPTSALAKARRGANLETPEHAVSFGMVQSLVEERLHLGVNGTIPVSVFQAQQPFFVDEREQYFTNALHFERFEDRLRVMTVSVGLGLAIIPQLHIGIGASLVNHADTTPHIYIPDASDQSQTETNAEVEITSDVAPHFGLVIKPIDDERLVLTSTVHLAAGHRVEGGGELQFWNYEYPEGQDFVQQRFEHQYGYEPLRVSAGMRSSMGDSSRRFTGHLNVLWAQWSTYVNRQAERAPDWSDTVSVDGGLAIEQPDRAVRVGVFYAPTPVPPQEGRTNYVDNTRVGGSLGLSEIWRFGTRSLSVTLSTSVQVLLARSQFKRMEDPDPIVDEFPESVDVNTRAPISASDGVQTNSPGFPGYRSEGWFALSGINIKWVQ